ncbi:TolC family protein [Fulvivirgaceae bacterium PWU4]|uniref:TolC family protein n=1 Tax=Chryseosolibacter histidini TaxID=2782349 RepID=A0AAP2DKT0_9BACT|nr:TolC family protein [Chryseosolibacter histidini]MBT1697324.1 TolC family protein [Chryseosolibacter histidini]
MKKLLTLMFFPALSLWCWNAAAQTYALEACIKIALDNNQQFKNSQLESQAADYRIKEVKSALMPTIDVVGQLMYYQDLPEQYAPASAFGGPEGQYKKLSMNMSQTTSGNLQMSQTIFNQTVITGLKAAKAVKESSALQQNVVRENLVYNVTANYYNIQVLNDNLARLAENIANLDKTAQINKVLKDNELVSSNIHNRILISLENLRNQYDNQKLQLDKSITTLKYLMNMPMDQSLVIDAFNYTEVLQAIEEEDIAQRPDILLQQSQVRLAELEKKSVAAGYFPVLSNRFSYGYTGYYDDFAPLKQINNDWIRSSYFVLTLKIPVFDGFQKQNQLRQKEIAIQKNINTLAMMKSSASKEVEDAVKNYQTNKNLVVNSKNSLDLAEQLFTSAQSEYKNGITSITELLDAQNDLSNARTNYSAALLNLKLAELSLKKANGTLIRS